ncbi:plasmid stabilization protein, partial [Clostridium sp. K04]|nr:plasmid stabilization protein [Clostridium sp. K04]
SIQLDIKGLKDEVKDLKEGQKIIEKKLDGVVEQTAELLEFRTTVKTKLDELKEVEEVTKVNCYDIAKLKAVK